MRYEKLADHEKPAMTIDGYRQLQDQLQELMSQEGGLTALHGLYSHFSEFVRLQYPEMHNLAMAQRRLELSDRLRAEELADYTT